LQLRHQRYMRSALEVEPIAHTTSSAPYGCRTRQPRDDGRISGSQGSFSAHRMAHNVAEVARYGTFGPDIAHGLLMHLILSKRITTEPTVSVAVGTSSTRPSRRT
jgi:hypothetical protein